MFSGLLVVVWAEALDLRIEDGASKSEDIVDQSQGFSLFSTLNPSFSIFPPRPQHPLW
jgi:hypothetical protein